MGITIKDVAAAAGVSTSTVSRVLTGNAIVAVETAETIRNVIKDLGYKPDLVARALRKKRSHLIGLIVPNLNSSYALRFLAALERELSKHEFLLAIATTSDNADTERKQIERLVAQGIDGLFFIPTCFESKTLALEAAEDIPVVQVLEADDASTIQLSSIQSNTAEPTKAPQSNQIQSDQIQCDQVVTDYDVGIQHLLRHFAREGRKRIAFVGEGTSSRLGEIQLKAFTENIAKAQELEQHSVRLGAQTTAFGQQAILKLLKLDPKPDAIICGNDLIALGGLRALQQMGIGFREVAITGFAGSQSFNNELNDLTCLRQPIEELAQEAVRLLEQRLSGLDDSPIQRKISPHLSVGKTA